MLEIASFLSLRITAAVVVYFARRVTGAPIGWLRSIIIGAADEVDEWLLEREIGQRCSAIGPALGSELFGLVSRHGFGVPPHIAAVSKRGRPRRALCAA
jgi:hypothetical protein